MCYVELNSLQCLMEYVAFPELDNILQCIEAEHALIDLEEAHYDDLDTGDISVRCSEPSDSNMFEEDDDDENLDFNYLITGEMTCYYINVIKTFRR